MYQAVEDAASAGGFTFKFFSWSYLSRLLFVFALMYFSLFLNSVSSSIAGYRTPWVQILDLDGRITGSVTLPDIGHDILPYSGDAYFSIPDRIVDICLIAFVALLIIHPKRFLIIRRTSVNMSLLYILRSVTVLVTSLPDASPACQAQFIDPVAGAYKRQPMFPRVFLRAAKLMEAPGKHITCGDMIFSGHGCAMMICALTYSQYFRKEAFKASGWKIELLCKAGRYMVTTIVAFGLLSIIATRLHYTLDVVIAIYLSYRVWKDYHTVIRVMWLKKQNFILRWLEAEEIINIEMRMHHTLKPFKWD
jgi:shingomyelin synthase